MRAVKLEKVQRRAAQLVRVLVYNPRSATGRDRQAPNSHYETKFSSVFTLHVCVSVCVGVGEADTSEQKYACISTKHAHMVA